MSEKRLAGKVALITGASRGIGAAIATRFAAEGAKVVVNYAHSEGEANKVVAAVTAAGGAAVAVKANMGAPAEIPLLFAAATKAFGRLDILVNNAAIMQRTFLPDVTAESIDAHFSVNVRGYLLAVKHAVELMTSGGCVILVGDMGGLPMWGVWVNPYLTEDGKGVGTSRQGRYNDC